MCAAVVCGHVWLLQAGAPLVGAGPVTRQPAAPGVLTRWIDVVSPPAAGPVTLPIVAPAPSLPSVTPRPALAAGPQRARQAAVGVTPSTPQQEAPAPDLEQATAPSAERALPTYATLLPPAMALRYRLQRGEQQGNAELRWAPDAAGYRLSLVDDLSPKGVNGRSSQGRLGEHGLAPERFAELRRQREVRAVNVDADAGSVSFSSSAEAHAWPKGGQDRLSWWIQLASVVQASPARFVRGERIELPVVGTHGAPEVWTFHVIGLEAAALADASLRPPHPFLALVREPTRLYDVRVQVWLDPQLHHLPARVRFTPVPRGLAQELTLQTADAAAASPTPP